MKPISAAVGMFVAVTLSFAQTASRQPVFEVASIKPSDPFGRGRFQITPGGTLNVEASTLNLLIQFAYDVRDVQISGAPDWVSNLRYDVLAKPGDAPNGPSETNQSGVELMRARLQALLEERFNLRLHRDKKDLPAYALVVAKRGPKLKEDPSSDTREGSMQRGRGHLKAIKIDMRFLAITLSRQVYRVVLNETGLQGTYDFELTWTPDAGLGRSSGAAIAGTGQTQAVAASGSSEPAIFTALQEQLGLKLEAKKEPVEVLVIDHVEKPSEN